MQFFRTKLFLKALFRRDEFSQFCLAEFIARRIYPRYKFSEFGRSFLYDEEFLACYERLVGKTNYHSLDRKFALDQMLKLTLRLPGDTVECGAYEGASSFFICRRIHSLQKTHFIFDSFAGLSEPQKEDGDYWKYGDLIASEAQIRQNLKDFDFVIYHKGWIPDKFPEVANRKFCFLHIDVDLYQPTLDSLKFFYDRTVAGGVILCDDYGFRSCPGATEAMEEFFRDKPEEIISLPTGQGLVIKRTGTER